MGELEVRCWLVIVVVVRGKAKGKSRFAWFWDKDRVVWRLGVVLSGWIDGAVLAMGVEMLVGSAAARMASWRC